MREEWKRASQGLVLQFDGGGEMKWIVGMVAGMVGNVVAGSGGSCKQEDSRHQSQWFHNSIATMWFSPCIYLADSLPYYNIFQICIDCCLAV